MKETVGMDRRSLLKLGGSAGMALGLCALPKWARGQAINKDVVLLVFLRGAADLLSFVQPVPGSSAPRAKYNSWRATGTRIANGIPVGDGLAMHPALAPLQSLLASNEMCLIPAVGGAQFNRSHFEQQDLIDSGAGTSGPPHSDGFLGRALDGLAQRNEPLASIAFNSLPPYSLRFSGKSPLSIPDFRTFGSMVSSGHRPDPNWPLKTRLADLYVPVSGNCGGAVLCETAKAAFGGIDDVAALRAETVPFPAARFAALAAMVRADDAGLLKFLTLDLTGWDTHHAQGSDAKSGGNFTGALARLIESLATSLRALYDAANSEGVWNRMTVVVISEFGRTTKQNGSFGTDHGFGGIGIVLGQGLRTPVYRNGFFPSNMSAPFYGMADTQNVVPRLTEVRQVLAQVLRDRAGCTAASLQGPIFPGLTIDTTAPRLFA